MNKHYFEQNCAVYTVLDLLNVIDNQYLYTSHVYIGTINSNDDAKQLKNYIVIWETIQKYVYVYNCINFHCIFCFSIEILKIYKTSCQYIQRYWMKWVSKRVNLLGAVDLTIIIVLYFCFIYLNTYRLLTCNYLDKVFEFQVHHF